MTLLFKIGFTFQGFNYGWFEGDLYRLPSKGVRRHYPLKKLDLKTREKAAPFYCLKKAKKTVQFCKDISKEFSKPIEFLIEHQDLPNN